MNLIIYFIGVLVSIIFGLRGIGVFGLYHDGVKYSISDIFFVILGSILGSWFTAILFVWGYGKPQEGHPDVS